MMSLLDSLIASSVNVENVAEDWLREYITDSRESTLRIVSLIFHTCGLSLNVSHTVFQVGWIDFVKSLEFSLPASALSTYPIIDETNNQGKKISKNVPDFIGMIFFKAEEDVLQDGFFVNELCALLYELTKSSLRAFRHTATVIVVKMITQLSNIAKNLTLQYSRICRQLSNCENQQLRESSSVRRESLENLLANSGCRISVLEDKITFLISVVLPKRFRDIFSSVRSVCLKELEVWLLEYPNAFMENKNLRYLGWALSDPNVLIRQKSIQTLKKVYSDEELVKHKGMRLFTFKFKGQILATSLDKRIPIAITAIQVISAIYRYTPDIISKEEKDLIFHLIYSEHLEIANEVAKFIDQVIKFALKDNNVSEKSKRCRSLLELKNVVIFTKGEEKIQLLVDAMLCQPGVEYMNDWESYMYVLLCPENAADESQCSETNLDVSLNIEEERIIVSLMTNSARQVFLDESPRSLMSKKLLAKKSARNIGEYHESSMNFFLKFLPKLMRKYMPDEGIISSLLSLCMAVDVNIGASNQDIQILFTSLLEISERQVDAEIHIACAKAMAHLCKGKSSIAKFVSSNFVNPFLQQIISNWEESLKNYSRKCAELEDFSDILNEEELIFIMEKNSERLFAASCHFGLKKFLDWEGLLELCRGCFIDENGRYPIPTIVMRNSLKTALTYILHELPIENVKENDMLMHHIDDFLLVGEYVLRATKEIDYTVRITAYHCVSQIMCIICQTPSSISDLWKDGIERIANILMENITALMYKEEGFDELSEKEERDLMQNYCSLILRGGLPPAASIHLLKNINMQLVTSTWPCIETTLLTLLSWNVEEFSMIVLGCLTSYYDEVLEKERVDMLLSQNFSKLMAIAEKIYKIFGSKMAGDVKASLKFHMKGILFATNVVSDEEKILPRIHFAQQLIVFAPILNPKFRGKLLDYLNGQKKSIEEKVTFCYRRVYR